MLAQKLDAVHSTIRSSSRYNVTLAEARARRAELAPFATPNDVAAALDASSDSSAETRYALVAALVDEHRTSKAPLWSSLLLIAFRPLLLTLRTRMGRLDNEDRDSRVLMAFLDAVVRVGKEEAGAYATAALQRATQRALVTQQTAENEEPELDSFDEDTHTPHDPHAVTLADVCVDRAWEASRASELAPLCRRYKRRQAAKAPPATRRHAA